MLVKFIQKHSLENNEKINMLRLVSGLVWFNMVNILQHLPSFKLTNLLLLEYWSVHWNWFSNY